jgi:rubrerythrin
MLQATGVRQQALDPEPQPGTKFYSMAYKSLKSKSIDPVEPLCKKAIYHSKEEAEDIVKYLNENRSGKEINVYKCNSCGFWHLTSRKK